LELLRLEQSFILCTNHIKTKKEKRAKLVFLLNVTLRKW